MSVWLVVASIGAIGQEHAFVNYSSVKEGVPIIVGWKQSDITYIAQLNLSNLRFVLTLW